MKKLLIVFASLVVACFLMIGVYLAAHNIGDGAGCTFKKGLVVAVEGDTGLKDIGIYFEKDTRTFYINRGMEYGCNVDSLTNALVGHESTVYYYDNIIHSDPYHIVKLTTDEKTWYSEE